eukprot:5636755-Amphidinium_carterae.2
MRIDLRINLRSKKHPHFAMLCRLKSEFHSLSRDQHVSSSVVGGGCLRSNKPLDLAMKHTK